MHTTVNGGVNPHYDTEDDGPTFVVWSHNTTKERGGGFYMYDWGLRIQLKGVESLFLLAYKYFHGSEGVTADVSDGDRRVGMAYTNNKQNLGRASNMMNTAKGLKKVMRDAIL